MAEIIVKAISTLDDEKDAHRVTEKAAKSSKLFFFIV